MAKSCAHPKESRSLLAGYDVICDACGEAVGRVALFPCVVLTAAEARAVAFALDALGDFTLPRAGRDALARMQAVR